MEDKYFKKSFINLTHNCMMSVSMINKVNSTIVADNSAVIEKSYYHQGACASSKRTGEVWMRTTSMDHLDSTKIVTGEVVKGYTYRAFREKLKRLDKVNDPVGDFGNYSYRGKELDGVINLYFFNARFYDATTGRFITVDLIQDGSNWYDYCKNNPTRYY